MFHDTVLSSLSIDDSTERRRNLFGIGRDIHSFFGEISSSILPRRTNFSEETVYTPTINFNTLYPEFSSGIWEITQHIDRGSRYINYEPVDEPAVGSFLM